MLAPADSRQVPTTQNEESIIFKLQLNCSARKSSKIQTLRLSPFSPLVRDIKKAVEDEFSIPACVQTLTYQLHTLPDEGNLLNICKYIRTGDTLTVDYSCDADVKKINEIVGWMRKVSEAMEKEKLLSIRLKIKTEAAILEGAGNKYDLVLAEEMFDWMDAKTFVNKVYFKDCGGLADMMGLYEKMLAHEWGEMSQTYRYLETFCCHAIAGFGETPYFRRMLIQHDVMRLAMQSMLRVKMEIKGTKVIEETDFRWSDRYSHYATKRVLEFSLHTICKYVSWYRRWKQGGQGGHAPLEFQAILFGPPQSL